MKKIKWTIIWEIVFILGLSSVVLCVFFHYRDDVVSEKYDESISLYRTGVTEYQEELKEYQDAQTQYEEDLQVYNNAVYAKEHAEDIPEDGMITVFYSINAAITENNSVGNEWDEEVSINGIDIYDGEGEIEVNAKEPFTIITTAVEDDKYPDVGSEMTIIYYANDEILEGVNKDINVKVREDDGRYAGNTANIKFTVQLQRLIDEIVIPEKPEEPAEPMLEEPIKPMKGDITVNYIDVAQNRNVVRIVDITALIVGILSLLSVFGFLLHKRKKR